MVGSSTINSRGVYDVTLLYLHICWFGLQVYGTTNIRAMDISIIPLHIAATVYATGEVDEFLESMCPYYELLQTGWLTIWTILRALISFETGQSLSLQVWETIGGLALTCCLQYIKPELLKKTSLPGLGPLRWSISSPFVPKYHHRLEL
jgi:hypothetical protein